MNIKYWKTQFPVSEFDTFVEHHICLTCGALVADRPQHTNWHKELGK